MTIKISAEAEHELVVRIAEGLQNTKPEYSFLAMTDLRWIDDYIKLFSEESRVKLERYLGDKPLSRLLHSEIWQELTSVNGTIEITPHDPLSSISFIKNTIAYARGIVDKIKNLPFRYRATVALPNQFATPILGKVKDRVDLPSGISIALGGALPSPLPVESENPLLNERMFNDPFGDNEQPQRALDNGRYYFSMPIMGYAVSHSSSALGRDFEDNIRAFYGAGIATGLLSYGWGTRSLRLPFIMFHSEPDRKLVATEKLEDDLIDRENSMATEDFSEKFAKNLDSEFEARLKKIGVIFNNETDCKRLFTACVWFYRAKMNRRPLDALLEATISIEVMLGDRKAADGIGLANLLGSRCAYLLGRSSTQRDNIAHLFRQIYSLRSNIVHEGRHTLVVGDRKIVDSALAMCAAIIVKELDIRKK